MIVRRPARASLVLAAILVFPAAAQQRPLQGLEEYVTAAIKEFEHPGLAMAIVKNDSVVFARGFGVRTLGESAPVDAHTLFAIGSSSKAFTGLSVAMLVDEGKVSWDAPITTYLPDFQLSDPYVTREITVRDALTHRSGLARTDLVWISGQFDSEELIRRLRFVKPASSFRTQYGYQNLMYLTAGMIVEKVSGKNWGQFVEERIFAPLGMRESNTSVTELAGLPNVAAPHGRVNDTLRPVPYRNIDHVKPAGSINSNVLDMAQWLRFQLAGGIVDDKPLLGQRALEETRTPQFVMRRGGGGPNADRDGYFSAYGMGWFLQDYRGKFVVHHGGNIDGMTALVAFMPDEKLGVVALTNYNGSPLPSALVFTVFDRYIGGGRDRVAQLRESRTRAAARVREAEQRADSQRVKGTSPTLALDKYAGTYADSANGMLRIAVENDKLVFRYGTQFTGDLEHWHYDTFQVRWRESVPIGGASVTFSINGRGQVSSVNAGPFGEFGRAPDAGAGRTR